MWFVKQKDAETTVLVFETPVRVSETKPSHRYFYRCGGLLLRGPYLLFTFANLTL